MEWAASPTSPRHKSPAEFLAMWAGEQASPGSTRTTTRLQLTLKPRATQAGASENQDDFFCYLPPLTPADMQVPVSFVPLEGKAASPFHNNSEEWGISAGTRLKVLCHCTGQTFH